MTVVKRVDLPEAISSRPRISRRVFFSLIVFAFFTVFLFSTLVSFRVFHARTGWAASLARVVPYPAALVDGRFIWYVDVVRLSQVFDANPVENTDPFDASLILLVRRAVVEMYADQFDLSLTRSDRDEARAQAMAVSPVVSWNEATYEEYVLDPLLLAQKVEEALKTSAEAQDIAKIRLQKIQLDLQAGMDFEGIARYRSEDPSASFGGDLGLLDREQLPSGLENMFDLPIGGVSDILEQQDFFSLVKVVGEELNTEGARTKVRLMIISVHKAGLSQIVDAYLVDHPAKYFVD
jgi:hypothetical protein